MKIALRVAAALLVLVVLIGAGFIALAPRFFATEVVRGAIERAASGALGRDVHYQELGIGLFPPTLVVVRPEVAGEGGDAPPFAVARSANLRVAVRPLLLGAVVVDSVVIDGIVLNIERTKKGVALPGPAPLRLSESGSAALLTTEGAPSGVTLAILAVEIRDGTIVFTDRTLSPAVEWRLQGVRGRVDLHPAEDSLEFELAAEVATGGRLEARGEASSDAKLELVVTFEELALDSVAPYLVLAMDPGTGESKAGRVLEGFASGSFEARASAASADLVLDLTLREARVGFDEIELSGPLQIAARLSGPRGRTEGGFDIDATDAEIRYSGVFAKPAGTKATVTGRIVNPGGTHSVDDIRLKIANLDAHASLETGDRTLPDSGTPSRGS